MRPTTFAALSRTVLVLCLAVPAASHAIQLSYNVGTTVKGGLSGSDADGKNGADDGRNGLPISPIAVSAFARAESPRDNNYGAGVAMGQAHATVDFGRIGLATGATASIEAPPTLGFPYAVGSTYSEVSAGANAGFFDDGYLVAPHLENGTKVMLTFTVPTEGTFLQSFSGLGSMTYSVSSGLWVNGQSASLTDFTLDADGNYKGSYSLSYEAMVGQRILVSMGVELISRVIAPNYTQGDRVFGSSVHLGMNFLNTSHLYLSSTTPGVSWVTESGHDYTAPVPEPSQLAMLIAGACGLLAVCRRRQQGA